MARWDVPQQTKRGGVSEASCIQTKTIDLGALPSTPCSLFPVRTPPKTPLPLRIVLVVTPVLQAERTKVPGGNHMDITRQSLHQDKGPHALQARIALAKHTHPIRTMVLQVPSAALSMINPTNVIQKSMARSKWCHHQ